MERSSSRTRTAVQFTKHKTHETAGLPDHARLGDSPADLRNATHHSVLAQDGYQPIACVDSILQRDDRCVGSQERSDSGARTFHVPKLNAEQYEIDGAYPSRVVGRLGWREMNVAARAQHAKAVRAHRRQMGPPGDEGDIAASLRQSRPEWPADPTSTNHCDPHRVNPCHETVRVLRENLAVVNCRMPLSFATLIVSKRATESAFPGATGCCRECCDLVACPRKNPANVIAIGVWWKRIRSLHQRLPRALCVRKPPRTPCRGCPSIHRIEGPTQDPCSLPATSRSTDPHSIRCGA